MTTLGPFAFVVPWALVALIALPGVWWLLRLTPPVPKRIIFPPIRLLFGIVTERETSARTPWWLLILRLTMAALIILAASRPFLNAAPDFDASGPLVLVVDNGWAAATQWDTRRDVALSLSDRALRAGRQVVLLTTAPPADGSAITVRALGAADARAAVAQLIPQPWPTDRGQAAEALADWSDGFDVSADVRWLSDGLDGPGADALGKRLSALGRVTVYGTTGDPVTVLRPPTGTKGGFASVLERSHATATDSPFEVEAVDGEGRILTSIRGMFSAGGKKAEVSIDAPTEILNRVERLRIAGKSTTGGTVLLDQRWRRRPVGIVDSGNAAEVQPLLTGNYYLRRALEGATTVRSGSLSALFEDPVSILMLPDSIEIPAARINGLEDWVAKGGILVRFAGPALARRTADEIGGVPSDSLLPVRLRGGDRIIGGAMSWRRPMGLKPFPDDTPFAGLDIPGDVKVGRQVLAQPTPDLTDKTWAALEDGTPLVTAEKRGSGWVVLFHTAADTTWSNLPISGLFVEMVRRIGELGQGVEQVGDSPPLAPVSIMNGFAELGAPAANVQPLSAGTVDIALASQRHPPGIYGEVDLRRAFNLTQSLPSPEVLPLADNMAAATYKRSPERDLTPWLFLAALILFLIDTAAGLWVRTGGGFVRSAAHGAAVLAMGGVLFAAPVHAQDKFALENSLETRLAYLETGDARVDEISRLGLSGLTTMLARRTAAELGPPQPVSPGRDELTFFPMIYWPVTPFYELDNPARLAVKEYLRGGGTILFDTQERGGGAQAAALRDLAGGLDLPPLVPVEGDHVLTRAFYLLNEFPGRYAGAPLWVERAGERVNDGVSPVVAGSNDWAAAWAMDEAQRPMFPVVPGGERQREMAYRFGINLVMYVLTGNYKADQVHLPAILKRLGQ